MQVRVSSGSVALDDPDDCTTFRVLLSDGARDSFPALLASTSAGEVDSNEVLISVDWIRGECAGRIGMGWTYRFANMLVLAVGKGWVTDDGSHFRARIEEL